LIYGLAAEEEVPMPDDTATDERTVSAAGRPEVRLDIDHPDFLVGLMVARGVRVGAADGILDAAVETAVEDAAEAGVVGALDATGDGHREALRAAVRDLLRRGGFKPTGRNKPASEYVANAAREGRFPRINNIVDVANLVSLESGLPVSLLDLDRAAAQDAGGGQPAGEHSAGALVIRFGMPGESYVFNRAGQSIDVAGLISVCRAGGEPVGNPVKDAMAAKTDDRTVAVLGVVYASRAATSPAGLQAVIDRFAALAADHAGAESTDAWVLAASVEP
jgi:DNA/RNA-binding domain of Phe-tRNA-synthetase-like protein